MIVCIRCRSESCVFADDPAKKKSVAKKGGEHRNGTREHRNGVIESAAFVFRWELGILR